MYLVDNMAVGILGGAHAFNIGPIAFDDAVNVAKSEMRRLS